jgi:hypothetical protein
LQALYELNRHTFARGTADGACQGDILFACTAVEQIATVVAENEGTNGRHGERVNGTCLFVACQVVKTMSSPEVLEKKVTGNRAAFLRAAGSTSAALEAKWQAVRRARIVRPSDHACIIQVKHTAFHPSDGVANTSS